MPGKVARKKPPSSNSTASTVSTAAPAKTTCVICCQSLNLAKDEALFCSGRCQQWLHRYCASVSVDAYQSIKADGSSFSCYDCYRRSKDEQLLLLEQSVLDLKAELAQLKSTPLETGPEATHATATLPSWLNGATLLPLPLWVSQTAVCLLVPHRRRELVGDMLIGNSTLSCMEWMSAPLAYPELAGWSQTLAMWCLFYLHSTAQYNPNL